MSVVETIITSILTSGLLVLIARTWITERLKNAIKNEYDLKLEEYKTKMDIVFNDQVKQRQIYDDLSNYIEDTFGSGTLKDPGQLSLELNKLFGKLALNAPDNVYRTIKEALIDKGVVYGKDVKPVIYCALRSSLFGKDTKMKKDDFVPHIGAEHIPNKKT